MARGPTPVTPLTELVEHPWQGDVGPRSVLKFKMVRSKAPRIEERKERWAAEGWGFIPKWPET